MAAYDTLVAKVTTPTFLRKSAEYGVTPRSDEEVSRMLNAAVLIDRATKAVKAAMEQAKPDRVKAALDALTGTRPDPVAAVKAAADVKAACEDESVREAALAYFAEQAVASQTK